VGRIGEGLPVFVDTHDTGMLKTEPDHPPEKGLNHPAVAAVEDLPAQDLNALEGGMGEFPDIRLQQFKRGQQKFLNLLETLLPDQLNEAAIYFPQGFLMDQVQPVGVHYFKQKQQFSVLVKMMERGTPPLFNLTEDLLRLHQIIRHRPVIFDDVDMIGQREDGLQTGPGFSRQVKSIDHFEMFSHRFMGNCHEQPGRMKIGDGNAAAVEKPGERIVFMEPVAVASGKNDLYKAGQGEKVIAVPFIGGKSQQLFCNLGEGMLAMDNLHHYRAIGTVQLRQACKNRIDFRPESQQVAGGKPADRLIEPDHLRADGLAEKTGIPLTVVEGLKKQPAKEFEGFWAPVVGYVMIDVLQGKTTELRQNDFPVAKRMTDFIEQFFKRRMQPLELFDHFEQGEQLRIDDHIAGSLKQIGLQRIRFYRRSTVYDFHILSADWDQMALLASICRIRSSILLE